jgi:hypothetical protein
VVEGLYESVGDKVDGVNATIPISARTLEKRSLRKFQIAHLREAASAYIPFIGMIRCRGKESD